MQWEFTGSVKIAITGLQKRVKWVFKKNWTYIAGKGNIYNAENPGIGKSNAFTFPLDY